MQGGGLVEGEDAARAGLWITVVAEKSLGAGGFVVERQPVGPLGHVVGQLAEITRRLVGDPAQGRAGLLGLDDARSLAADEQQVIARTTVGPELAHGNAFRRVAVELGHVLHDPSGRLQQGVDGLARLLLGRQRHACCLAIHVGSGIDLALLRRPLDRREHFARDVLLAPAPA